MIFIIITIINIIIIIINIIIIIFINNIITINNIISKLTTNFLLFHPIAFPAKHSKVCKYS